MRDSRCGAEITVQSMPDALERWHGILHMWTHVVQNALKKSSLKWTDLQAKTTVILPKKKN